MDDDKKRLTEAPRATRSWCVASRTSALNKRFASEFERMDLEAAEKGRTVLVTRS